MTRQNRFYRRIWASLHEPRTVTAIMVTIYAFVLVIGVLAIVNWHSTQLLWMAFVVLAAGGGVGVASAWTGAYYAEWAGAAFSAWGMFLMVPVNVEAGLRTDYTPTLWAFATVIALFFAIRMISIAPYSRRGEPRPEAVAAAKAALAQEEYERAREQRDR